MNERVRQQLIKLNRSFYKEFAVPFAESRREPQPGFYKLAENLPKPCKRLLDVGCGEGRLGRFLRARIELDAYDGVDGSPELLSIARQRNGGNYWVRDLSQPGALSGLAEYDCIACLAVLQHIPGREYRGRLLEEMATHLAPGGRIMLSTWQFLTSERQRDKIIEWPAVGLSSDAVERNDYLLSWRKGGTGLRYVCFIDKDEMTDLARPAGLQMVTSFRSDGREGDLNLYAILAKDGHR